MPSFGVWEWVIILVIVLVIFGASRLTDIGKGLGGAISEFKKAVQEEQDESAREPGDLRGRSSCAYPDTPFYGSTHQSYGVKRPG